MKKNALLQKKQKLGIFIDTTSLDHLLSEGNPIAKTILKYSTSEPFEFLRSPNDTKYVELEKILKFHMIYDGKGNLDAYEIKRNGNETTTSFGWQMKDIDQIGRYNIYNKDTLNEKEKESLIITFIQASLYEYNISDIFIINKKEILKNRLWFESHFPGTPLNIVTIDEAKEIMDLFLKYNNKYYISGNFTCNKGYWYFLSFRSKIPYFHFGNKHLNAFSNRFIYLLMSLDEMGFQYYLGVNNDTINNMIYHFNYFISLITGIFDSLALATKNKYNLSFKNDHMPWKTSLNPKIGKDFLKAVRDNNPSLRDHINKYVNFIKLIYELREIVLHREMLKKTAFEYRNGNEKWEMNFIFISRNIANYIKSLNDKPLKYDKVTKWGIYTVHSTYSDHLIEPYHFSKTSLIMLIKFSNDYLKFIGYNDYFQELKKKNKNDRLLKDIEIFKKDKLGF